MDPRRKRLLFRCQHCGMKENDILLGRFAGRHMAELEDADVERLEAMLEAGDNDLYDWITGKAPVPAVWPMPVTPMWCRRTIGSSPSTDRTAPLSMATASMVEAAAI